MTHDHATLRTDYDAVVVGGGHNGLVAGFYLAQAGLSVLVLERRAQLGGLCGPIEFFPGYRGAITNTPSGLESRVQTDMRLEHYGLTYDRPDPTVIFPLANGDAFRGFRSRDAAYAEVKRIAPKDVDAYYEVLEYYNQIAKKMAVSVFREPPSLLELVSRFQTPQEESDFREVMFGNIADFLDERLTSPDLKALLSSLSVSAGNIPPSMPGSAMGLLRRPLSLFSDIDVADDDPRRHAVRGSTGLPKGGMGSVAEAMAASARAAGCALLTGVDVASIDVDSVGRVRAVTLSDGREFRTRIVVSCLNPKTTLLGMVGAQHLPGEVADGLQALVMKGAAYKLVLALNGLPTHASARTPEEAEQYAACQFRYSPTVEYLEQAYDDYKYGRPSRRPKLLGLIPSVMDPSLTPPGKHLLSLNVWYAPYQLADGHWTAKTKADFNAACIDTLEEFLPDIRDKIEDVRAFSPLDFEREYGLVEGHQTHGNMTPGGMFGFRPTPHLARYRTPVDGLYLGGSGSWPGGTVTGVPGYNASHAALADRFQAMPELGPDLDVPSAG